MKDKIRKWLGINELEELVGKPEKKSETAWRSLFGFDIGNWYSEPLFSRYERLKRDFEELDRKFDLLERYLQIELVKTDVETQVYDWADKKSTREWRKTKTYEAIREERNKGADEDED